MALPTKEKTWQYNINQLFTGWDNPSGCRLYLYYLKESLKTFGSAPWAVVCSSGYRNGTTWTYDTSDNWTGQDALVWALPGSNHSWIVLKQTGLGTDAAICIDLGSGSGNEHLCYLYLFPTGIGTPGSLTNRPTATDEVTLLSNETHGGNYGVTRTVLNVMQSTDGESTRVVALRQNSVTALWFFDKVKNPVSAWTVPIIGGARANSTYNDEKITYGIWNDAANAKGRIGSTNCSFYMTSEGYATAMQGEQFNVPDDDTGEWPMCPVGLCTQTSPHVGARKGTIKDLWWTSSALNHGDTLPDDGSKKFAAFGDMIFPWDEATVPKTA